MENIIQKRRAFVVAQIQKSFNSGINIAEETNLEKAHQDGEMHPNGKWVWVSSANGGKGDWRTANGRAHKKHQETHSNNAGTDKKAEPDKSNNADPRDKNAQDSGFKDYKEMRGYQDYVTSKNLLKKRSMQFKTKEDTKKELEANVAKYEKEHADVIKRIAENKKAKSTKPDNERKFKENFKDASDDVLQKILDGKIQAVDQEKKWAADIINERKKSGASATTNKGVKAPFQVLKPEVWKLAQQYNSATGSMKSKLKTTIDGMTNGDAWTHGDYTAYFYDDDIDEYVAVTREDWSNNIPPRKPGSTKDSDLINDIKSNEDAFIKVCGLSDVKRVVSIRETPTSVFIKYERKSGQEQEFPLTKNIANLVLKEAKAKKSTTSGNKSDKKKAGLPFTNLTKHSQVIDYAKTIDGADFEEIDSGWGDKNSKAFRLNYNDGSLKLDVDFLNNSEYVYTFKDKNDNPLYEVRSTRQNDETDWSVMLNPRKWANLVKSNISKYILKRKAEQTRYFNLYNRSNKYSYYDKYFNAKSAVDRYNRSLDRVDKILQLS